MATGTLDIQQKQLPWEIRDLYLLVSKREDLLRHVLLMVQVWRNLGIKSTIDVEHHMIKMLLRWEHCSSNNNPSCQCSWHQSVQHRLVNTAIIKFQLLIFTLLKNPSSKWKDMWGYCTAKETFADWRWKTEPASPVHSSLRHDPRMAPADCWKICRIYRLRES